jgi:nucleotide-binding universal stress UspA family protein
MNYQRLLLTHDGSALADVALNHAAAISRATGAEVLVLRSSEAAGREPEHLRAHEWRELIDQPPEGPREEAHPPLSDAVGKLRGAGVKGAGSLVVRGEAGEAIVEAAARLDCDLIAISSHGLSGVRRAVMGSVSSYVIRHAEGMPVLLCHEAAAEEIEYRKLLVALDGSELGNATLPHVEYLARSIGAEVVLVRVIDTVPQMLAQTTSAGTEFGGSGEIGVEIAESSVAAQRAAGERELEAVATSLREAGVPQVTALIIEGTPGTAIVEATEAHRADLVFIGTHGRGGLGRALLGSVADHVALHTSRAAVMMVRARP